MEHVIVNSQRWFDLTPLDGEEWIDLECSNNYCISNYGRVMSKERFFQAGFLTVHRKHTILKCIFLKSGYLRVSIVLEGKKKQLSIHRLVANAFIPNPEGFPQINHKNEDKADNRVVNLEWCTAKYNINYGTAKERIIKTRLNRYGRNIIQYRMDGSIVHVYRGMTRLHRQTGYNDSAILKVCIGQQLTSYGYVWRYEGDAFDKYPITYDKKVHASRVGRGVVKYDLNGEVVKIYEGGLKETLQDYPNYYSIRSCLNGYTKTAHGFIWRYIGSPKPEPIEKKRIVQYTMDCQRVSVFDSITDAIKDLGYGTITSVCDCLHKKTYSALGFIWRYENETQPTLEEQYKVVKIDKEGKIVGRFNSVKDALLSVGGKTFSSISLCLNGKQEYSYGYKWRYIKRNEEEGED